MMKKTAIFYGPVGGSTEYVAKKMQEIIGQKDCDLLAVKDAVADDLLKYDNLVFGIATIGNETWHSEPVKSGWFTFINILEKSNIEGKTVALFGLGDQIRYADHFVDAMGDLYEILKDKNVRIVGNVKPDDYEFKDSKALVDGLFVGLPIDEDFESERTLKRISVWVNQVLPLFK
jgi:flavodoxin I